MGRLHGKITKEGTNLCSGLCSGAISPYTLPGASPDDLCRNPPLLSSRYLWDVLWLARVASRLQHVCRCSPTCGKPGVVQPESARLRPLWSPPKVTTIKGRPSICSLWSEEPGPDTTGSGAWLAKLRTSVFGMSSTQSFAKYISCRPANTAEDSSSELTKWNESLSCAG